MFHENIFYLESFLGDLYNIPDYKNANINHVFHVKNYLAHINYCQELHGKADSEQNYRN